VGRVWYKHLKVVATSKRY